MTNRVEDSLPDRSTLYTPQSPAGFSANNLKYIAIIAMLIDHIAWAFVPYESSLGVIMHFIGRITGPTMFYFAAEGYHHTRHIGKYLGRLALFAGISYLPFIFFNNPALTDVRLTQLNVMFTIFFGVLAIHIRHKVKNPVLRWGAILLCLLCTVASDWGVLGFLIIFVFDYFRGKFSHQAFAYVLLIMTMGDLLSPFTRPIFSLVYSTELSFSFNDPYFLMNMGMFLPLILLRKYNGSIGKGGKFAKWLFYIFYPLHLVVLGLLKRFL